ncbi:M48 family metalloprotease [Flavisolibacter sp. BT320]|nr:M48 family metalloprotease [Flavisolibacter longurius]
MITRSFTEKEILTADEANYYLNALAKEIFKGNPSLNSREIRILFSKSAAANAYSMGEGTILFNIGLFHRMENEAQVAFALCHELAHYLLDHGNSTIHKYVNTVYSDEFQKQLKNIQKSAYRQNQQLEQLAKCLLFRSRRHSREYEQAADSMALELMKNTPFDLNGVVSTLALLDTAETDKFSAPLQLEKRFHFTSYPFKKSWLESESLFFTKSTEEANNETDSLKTHPDCKSRIKAVQQKQQHYQKTTGKKFVVDKAKFDRLKNQFDYEIVEHCFQSNRVSKALYLGLQMLNKKPDDVFLHTMVGRCLNEIYTRQKAHELGKIVDLPDNSYTKDYNNLLRLLQNIRLSELAALSYYYLEAVQPQFSTNKDFVSAWVTSKNHFDK